MVTHKPRINVTLEQDTVDALAFIAGEGGNIATVARELILDALERREDMALSRLAEVRERESKGITMAHEDVWK